MIWWLWYALSNFFISKIQMSFDWELYNNISSFRLIRKVKGNENLQMRTDVILFHVMQPMPLPRRCVRNRRTRQSRPFKWEAVSTDSNVVVITFLLSELVCNFSRWCAERTKCIGLLFVRCHWSTNKHLTIHCVHVCGERGCWFVFRKLIIFHFSSDVLN